MLVVSQNGCVLLHCFMALRKLNLIRVETAVENHKINIIEARSQNELLIII